MKSKNNMEKLYTATQVAEQFGVCRQTVTNWVKGGVLPSLRVGRVYYIEESQLKRLSKELSAIGQSEQELTALQAELQEQKKALQQEVNAIRHEIHLTKGVFPAVFQVAFFKAIPEMLHQLGLLNGRETLVLQRIAEGDSLSEISENIGITRERVRQIFYKAIRKGTDLSDLVSMKDENEALKRELRSAQEVIQMLKKKLAEKESEPTPEDVQCNEELWELLQTDIASYLLSVRAVNCLRSLDISNVGDLVRYGKTDILKARNLGHKTLDEIVDFVEGCGLTFNYDVDSVYLKHSLQAK